LKGLYIDDLFTYLTTAIELIKHARKEGMIILKECFGLFDRKQYDKSLESELNIHLNSLVDSYNFINAGLNLELITEETGNKMRFFHENPLKYSLKVVEENPEWIRSLDEKIIENVIIGYERNEMLEVSEAIKYLTRQ
jgi:hypothetical protein